ncbi:hypothetical protein PENANT_c042G07846 [Penicillium antarcticum]|uniref:Uncharacterized protein n=1 Tax=Penicillium antarcticum TaxID=416450 RepID=A0A1V6PSC7_9EURO|nr:hypothetical protein PENANT_c042G07846 [Penicillium antarcticum]
MFALFMNLARGPGPALGQKSRPGPSTGLENPAQNPTQPGLGPGWARVELGSAEVYSHGTKISPTGIPMDSPMGGVPWEMSSHIFTGPVELFTGPAELGALILSLSALIKAAAA